MPEYQVIFFSEIIFIEDLTLVCFLPQSFLRQALFQIFSRTHGYLIKKKAIFISRTGRCQVVYFLSRDIRYCVQRHGYLVNNFQTFLHFNYANFSVKLFDQNYTYLLRSYGSVITFSYKLTATASTSQILQEFSRRFLCN